MTGLTHEEMTKINGGIRLTAGCIAASIGMGISLGGGILSLATLNPVGLGLSVAGIFAGAGGYASECL